MKKDIFDRSESKSLEIKEAIPSKNQIIKTIVAFANGQGGEIIIGVEDKTNRIIGVSDKVRDEIFEDLSSSIYDSASPTILPEIFEKNINNKMLVVIKIYPGTKPPYFVKSEGSKKGVYLRVGTTTKRASEEYIEELMRQQKKIHFDEEATQVKLKDLNATLLKGIYGTQVTETKLIMDKVLIRSESHRQLTATRAGVLFFHENPQEIIEEAIVICTEFKGKVGRDILRTFELTGPIPMLVDSSFKLITSWIERDFGIKKNGKLEGRYLIPLEALREGIINALIHRKYFIPGAVKIALFEDRLEIFSPGGFPGLISAQNIGDGTTFLRNPTLAKLARKHKLMEKLGSGVRLILDLCKSEKLREPMFNENGDFVKLTFFFDKVMDDSLSDEEKILTLGIRFGKIRIKDIVDQLKISRNTATRKINQLILKGKCSRHGVGPSVYFDFNV